MTGTMYHLALDGNVSAILSDGLEPSAGANSSKIKESRPPAVYLSDAKGLPYWRILLDCSALLEVDMSLVPDVPMDSWDYTDYSELAVHGRIPPGALRRIDLPPVDAYAMRKLYLGAFEDVCRACVLAAKCHWYLGHDPRPDGLDEMLDGYDALLDSLLACMRKLDFKSVSQKEYRAVMLRDAEDGEFVMADWYVPDAWDEYAPRLWEMLACYPKYPRMEFAVRETALHRLIGRNWTGRTLHMEGTGGWSP